MVGNADSATYYNSIAEGYDELYREEQLVKLYMAKKLLLEKFLPDSNTRVLDVGCGTGISSDFWAQQFGSHVVGIDPAEKLIATNKNKLCELIVCGAEDLPFSDSSFDLVVSFTAVQNFSDIERGLSEMLRVAKPGAWFVITTLTKGPQFERIHQLLTAHLSIVEETIAKNDTIFLLSRR